MLPKPGMCPAKRPPATLQSLGCSNRGRGENFSKVKRLSLVGRGRKAFERNEETQALHTQKKKNASKPNILESKQVSTTWSFQQNY